MSNLQPLFVTAPRLKLYVNNNVIGYAVGFNINISIDVQPVYVIGQYAPVSLEPTMYNIVTGTMQIVRLNKTNRANSGSYGTLNPAGTIPSSNLFDAVTGELNSTTGAGVSNTPLAQSQLHMHVNPEQLLLSRAFDVKLYMKVPNAANTGLEEKEWFQISTCRITSRNTNITMGQIVNEPVSFQGLLATPTAEGKTQFTLDGSIVEGA